MFKAVRFHKPPAYDSQMGGLRKASGRVLPKERQNGAQKKGESALACARLTPYYY